MSAAHASLADLGRLDRLARQHTAVHGLDPRAKMVAAAVFLLCVVSFDRYQVAALLPYAVFPVALAASGRIPFGYLGWRVLAVAPFAVMIGAFNPWFDRAVLLHFGGLEITAGWVSLASILVRVALTVGTALVLVAVTGFEELCRGAQRLGVPRAFTALLALLYRYLFVLADETLRVLHAHRLRARGRRGLGIRVGASALGHLLLRTLERARRIDVAMRCRGFDGTLRSPRELHWKTADTVFVAAWCAVFVALRFLDLPGLLGALAAGGLQ